MPSFITVSGSTFTVSATASSDIGTYLIDVTLSDGTNTPVTQFSIVVNANQPPDFGSALVAQSITVGFTITYSLPAYSDPEGQPTTLVSITLSSGAALPSFIVHSGVTLTISPTLNAEAGPYTLAITLSDGFNNAVKSLVVTITENQAPYFSTALVAQSVMIEQTRTYALPTMTDPES